MEPIVVYFTKGLADVVAAEISQLTPQAEVGAQADRFVIVALDDAELTRLRSAGRTFDDIRLLVAGPGGDHRPGRLRPAVRAGAGHSRAPFCARTIQPARTAGHDR